MRDTKRYIFVFIMTSAIFVIAWSLSSYFTKKKISEIYDIQNRVAVDILSSETQYALFEELSCDDTTVPLLSRELSLLAERIGYAEQAVSSESELMLLKEQYTILEVKDFLLAKRIGARCGNPPVTLLYFYGKKDTCEDCVKEEYVLNALRSAYPSLRVYSFDFDLSLSTIDALKAIYDVSSPLPVLVVNGKTLHGFQSRETLETLLGSAFSAAKSLR